MAENVSKATHSGELKIGDLVLKCAVLEDGTRVLSQRSVFKAMGRSGSTGGIKQKNGAHPLPRILAAANLTPFITDDLRCAITPIQFKTRRGGNAYGYRAEILPEICNVYLEARESKVLNLSQEKVAAACELLVRGFARIGIIALVDEATGYQYDRDRYELFKILDAYINKELLPWAKRFPDEYYQELFRLRGWRYSPMSVARPQYVGKLTNELIYDRLPPGIKEELQRKNPITEKRWRRHRHHQYLTVDLGVPHLEKLLVATIALMKASPNWSTFKRLFARAFPKKGDQLLLDMPHSDDEQENSL